MKHADVFDLLKVFNDTEKVKFKNFLNSPFFDIRKNVSILFDLIYRNNEMLIFEDYSGLIQKIRKNIKVKENTLQQYLSLLLNYTMQFLAFSSFLNDNILFNLKINDYFLRTGNTKLFLKNSAKTKKLISNMQLGEKSLLYSFCYYDTMVTFKINSKDSTKEKGIIEKTAYYYKSLSDIILFTVQTYVITYCNIISQRINSGNEEKYDELKEIPDLIKQARSTIEFDKSAERQKFLKMYELLFNTYSDLQKENNYLKYRNYFRTNNEIFNLYVKRLHFNLLLNYCSIKIRTKNIEKYMLEQINLYDIYIDNDFYKAGSYKYLNSIIFVNYIILSSSVRKYDKLLSFIDKTELLLDRNEKNDLKRFALAHYYFGKGEYLNAINNINDIKMKTFIYRYQLITLELKIYFVKLFKPDNKDINFAIVDRILHNHNKQISIDKFLTKFDKIRLQKMFRYYRKLYTYSTKYLLDKSQTEDLEFLKKELESEIDFAMKIWIIEKIDEILTTGKIKLLSYST